MSTRSRLEGNADAFEQPSESWERYHVLRAIYGHGSVSAMIAVEDVVRLLRMLYSRGRNNAAELERCLHMTIYMTFFSISRSMHEILRESA